MEVACKVDLSRQLFFKKVILYSDQLNLWPKPFISSWRSSFFVNLHTTGGFLSHLPRVSILILISEQLFLRVLLSSCLWQYYVRNRHHVHKMVLWKRFAIKFAIERYSFHNNFLNFIFFLLGMSPITPFLVNLDLPSTYFLLVSRKVLESLFYSEKIKNISQLSNDYSCLLLKSLLIGNSVFEQIALPACHYKNRPSSRLPTTQNNDERGIDKRFGMLHVPRNWRQFLHF